MKPVHVVGYGMSDALGINPTECYQKMLDPNDYSREIPGMKKQCEEIFHLIKIINFSIKHFLAERFFILKE